MSMTTVLETLASALVLANIMLLARRHIANFAVGIVAVLLYAYIFWKAGLYSSMLLQAAFLGLNMYGWWAWRQSRAAQGTIRIAPLSQRDLAMLASLTLAGGVGLGLAMASWTDAQAPWWDAALTALSLAAQLLLARRHVETWPVWCIVNVIAIGLYGSQLLVSTTVLYVILLGLAVHGWRQWKRAAIAQG
jgi:nicotinamide mononucleotide transporter